MANIITLFSQAADKATALLKAQLAQPSLLKDAKTLFVRDREGVEYDFSSDQHISNALNDYAARVGLDVGWGGNADNVRDALTEISNNSATVSEPRGFIARRASGFQSIPAGTNQIIDFTIEDADQGDVYDGTNKFTPDLSGAYLINCLFQFSRSPEVTAGQNVVLEILINGANTSYPKQAFRIAVGENYVQNSLIFTRIVELNAGDEVQIQIQNPAGQSLGYDDKASFSAYKMAEIVTVQSQAPGEGSLWQRLSQAEPIETIEDNTGVKVGGQIFAPYDQTQFDSLVERNDIFEINVDYANLFQFGESLAPTSPLTLKGDTIYMNPVGPNVVLALLAPVYFMGKGFPGGAASESISLSLGGLGGAAIDVDSSSAPIYVETLEITSDVNFSTGPIYYERLIDNGYSLTGNSIRFNWNNTSNVLSKTFEVNNFEEYKTALEAQFDEKSIYANAFSLNSVSAMTIEAYGINTVYSAQDLSFSGEIGSNVIINDGGGNARINFMGAQLNFNASIGSFDYEINIPIFCRRFNFGAGVNPYTLDGLGAIFYEKLTGDIPTPIFTSQNWWDNSNDSEGSSQDQINTWTNTANTGIIQGLPLSVTDVDEVTIGVGHAHAIDRTDASNPLIGEIDVDTPIVHEAENIGNPSPVIYMYLDKNKDVHEFTTNNRERKYDGLVSLGVYVQDGLEVTGVVDVGNLAFGGLNHLQDFYSFSGLMRKGSNISLNAGGLTLTQNDGEFFNLGANFHNNAKDPNVFQIALTNPINFTPITPVAASVLTPDQTNVDPNQYWNGSALAPVSNNDWTIQRVYMAAEQGIFIQYGENIYNTLSGAESAFAQGKDSFNINPLFGEPQNAHYLGALFVMESETDLANAVFKPSIAPFGQGSSGGGGGGGTNLVTSVFGRQGAVIAEASDYDADQVDYDNATSGLSATDVQGAIDEVAASSGGISEGDNLTGGTANRVVTTDGSTNVDTVNAPLWDGDKLRIETANEVLGVGDDSFVDKYISIRPNNKGGGLFGLDTGLGPNGSLLIQAGDLKGLGLKANLDSTLFGTTDPDIFIDNNGDSSAKGLTLTRKLNFADYTNPSAMDGDEWRQGNQFFKRQDGLNYGIDGNQLSPTTETNLDNFKLGLSLTGTGTLTNLPPNWISVGKRYYVDTKIYSINSTNYKVQIAYDLFLNKEARRCVDNTGVYGGWVVLDKIICKDLVSVTLAVGTDLTVAVVDADVTDNCAITVSPTTFISGLNIRSIIPLNGQFLIHYDSTFGGAININYSFKEQ